MTNSLFISETNPVRLHEGKAPESGYFQKFSNIDDTYMQVRTQEAGNRYELNICFLNGRIARETAHKQTVAGSYIFHTFNPAFNRLRGLHKLVLTERNSVNAQRTWESAPICIAREYETLPLIQYRHSKNNEIRYADFDYFSLRVEGGFEMHNEQPKMINTVYMNGNLQYNMLHSHRYFTRIFHAGGTFGTNWDITNTIHRAFGCDTVFIDGVGYVQYEGAEWTANQIDHYAPRTWTTELVPTRARLTREANLIEDDLLKTTGFWRPTDYWWDDTFWRTH